MGKNTPLSFTDFKSCARDFFIKRGLQTDQIILKKELDVFFIFSTG